MKHRSKGRIETTWEVVRRTSDERTDLYNVSFEQLKLSDFKQKVGEATEIRGESDLVEQHTRWVESGNDKLDLVEQRRYDSDLWTTKNGRRVGSEQDDLDLGTTENRRQVGSGRVNWDLGESLLSENESCETSEQVSGLPNRIYGWVGLFPN